MHFKFKIRNIANPAEVVTDNAVAADEAQLKSLYKQLGFDVIEILESSQSSPMPMMPQDMQPNLDGLKTLGISDEPLLQQPPQSPKPIVFSDNGVEYKIVDGTIYKRDWVVCSADEYLVTDNDGNELEDVNVMRLDWVTIGNGNGEETE